MLPLNHFIVEVLSSYPTRITHIHPNSWKILISFMSLCWLHCIMPFAHVFASMYALSHKVLKLFIILFSRKKVVFSMVSLNI